MSYMYNNAKFKSMYEVAKFAVGTLKLIYFACLKAKAAYKKRFGGANIIFCEVLMYKW